MKNKRLLPYAAITFVMIMWGLSFLSIKVTVSVLGPMGLAFSRFIIASILLILVLKIKEPQTRLHKKDIPLMSVAGIVGITIYFFFENNGVKFTTASTASMIIATIPIFTAISDYIIFRNKMDWAKVMGVLLSFVGVYLLVIESGQLGLSANYFKGNLLMFGAALSWVVYNLATRPLGKSYSQLAITTYQTLFGTLAIFPFIFHDDVKWQLINGSIIANVLFLAVFCSAAGYFLYVYTIGELGVSITSVFINLIPVVTVLSSYIILGEKITFTQMIGGGTIIAAVYLADINNWLPKRKTVLDKSQSI